MTRSDRFSAAMRAALVLLAALLSPALPVWAEPIAFRQALDMALKHSGLILAAQAERTRASERYQVEHYTYYPTIVFGSGIGYSFGQPIAVAGQAPSIFNVTHTQTVYNAASKESIKAAHSDFVAADIDYNDRADQVILDTALIYIELDSTMQRLTAAQTQKQSADYAFYIAQQRQQEGVGSAVESKRAELDAARVDLRIAELQANAETLRARLAGTIGQPAATVETVTESIPGAPAPQTEAGTAAIAMANSAGIRAAEERALAAHQRARSQHKMNYPSIDFAGQYALFSNELNHYSDFFRNFQRNNYSFGLNFRIPVFNLSQNAAAVAADAEALKADADAQNLREQVAADAVKARNSVRQLEAMARISRLEYEVSQANIDAVKLQSEQGHATARDEAMARAGVANQQVLLLQSQFDYVRAQLQLLRQTGGLHDWALGK